ncbi:MAG: hypothetical protein PHI31_06295 [Desulfuromonadaceae bacterium]|nr:hypothetical protein [Desulfuromonadaceae bacterium]
MDLIIDEKKIEGLLTANHAVPDANGLTREGRVFFIGANLPIHSTLETMYESYCQESSDLFHITFGDAVKFEENLEMLRQIKRNFSIRLMGRIGYRLSELQIQRTYLSGLDILDMPVSPHEDDDSGSIGSCAVPSKYKAATEIFPHWSVVSSIQIGQCTPRAVHERIGELLRNGIIPLLDAARKNVTWNEQTVIACYRFIAAEWHRHRVPLKSIVPLLRLTTPFVLAQKTGYLRDVIEKLDDRRILAASDLRRHLRTRDAEASFESAGL